MKIKMRYEEIVLRSGIKIQFHPDEDSKAKYAYIRFADAKNNYLGSLSGDYKEEKKQIIRVKKWIDAMIRANK